MISFFCLFVVAKMNQCSNHNLQIKLITNSVLSAVSFLGFDVQSNEKHHKIILNSLTFAKPNQKGSLFYSFFNLPQKLNNTSKKHSKLLFIFYSVNLIQNEHSALLTNVGHNFSKVSFSTTILIN